MCLIIIGISGTSFVLLGCFTHVTTSFLADGANSVVSQAGSFMCSRPCSYVHRPAAVTQSRRVSDPPIRATTPPGDVCVVRLRHKKAGRKISSFLFPKEKNTALALHATPPPKIGFTRRNLFGKLIRPIGDCIYCRLPTRCSTP